MDHSAKYSDFDCSLSSQFLPLMGMEVDRDEGRSLMGCLENAKDGV